MIHRDPYNETEKAVVAALQKANCSGFLPEKEGGREIASLIHPKIRRDEKGEPIYFEHETPAVGVYCSGKERDDTRKVQVSSLPLNIVLDIVNFGGHVSFLECTEADSDVKLLAGRIEQYLRDVRRCATIDPDFSQACQITEIGASIFEPAYMGDKGWIFEGGISFQVTIVTEG